MPGCLCLQFYLTLARLLKGSWHPYDIPCIRMDIVKIHVYAFVKPHSHHCKPFGGETICASNVCTGLPFHTLEINPRIIGECIESRANSRSPRCRGSIWVVISLVQMRMVIKVLLRIRSASLHIEIKKKKKNSATDLLDLNHIIAILRKFGANGLGIGGFVSRHTVAVENGWKTGDIEREDIELAGRGRPHRKCCRQRQNPRQTHFWLGHDTQRYNNCSLQ